VGTAISGARCWPCNEWNLAGLVTAMDEGDHISTTDARAGSTPHMTRYILAFGLLLVIAAFVAIVLIAK
jgi:hypothetical protein